MKTKKVTGKGRLVPARTTAIGYQVFFGIPTAVETPKKGRGAPAAKWVKCSVELEHPGSLPSGSYFLYTTEGKVHQLKYVESEWQYLAVAA